MSFDLYQGTSEGQWNNGLLELPVKDLPREAKPCDHTLSIGMYCMPVNISIGQLSCPYSRKQHRYPRKTMCASHFNILKLIQKRKIPEANKE